MREPELLKLKWAVTLLTIGRANDAREELLELLAYATSPIQIPELLKPRAIDLRVVDGAKR